MCDGTLLSSRKKSCPIIFLPLRAGVGGGIEGGGGGGEEEGGGLEGVGVEGGGGCEEGEEEK